MNPSIRWGRERRLRLAWVVAVALFAIASASCSSKDTPTAPGTGAPMATVRGSVQLPDHTAAQFAIVGLLPDPAYPPTNVASGPIAYFTDSVGTFEIFDVPAGHYVVLSGIPRDPPIVPLDLSDFSLTDSLVTTARVAVWAPNAPAPPVHLTLEKPGAFRGRVVDALTGHPTEAMVTTLGAITITAADSDGVYVLRGVARGTWTVRAIQFVDSVTTRIGAVSGTLMAAGDTVALPDLRIALTAPIVAARPAVSLDAMRRELRRMAALRERRMAGLPR
jgi:hypothetical protein